MVSEEIGKRFFLIQKDDRYVRAVELLEKFCEKNPELIQPVLEQVYRFRGYSPEES